MSQLKKLQNELIAAGVDAALISSELNQRYLSDFAYTDGYVLVTHTEAFLLTDSRYVEAAKMTVTELEVILASGGMMESVKQLVNDRNIKTLAIEDSTLSVADFDRFKTLLEGCQLVSGASAMLRRLREIKTPEELRRISAAQAITDAAFAHILEFITPERTEREVALELEFFMRNMGAESTAFDTIAVSGPASSLPHGVPSDVKLRSGFLTMDFGAKYQGYCSDMTRTVVIGKADDEIKLVYNTVLKAQTAALEAIRAGIVCRDADEVARKVIRDAGYGPNFGHSLGHGVGMFIHETPNLSPKAAPSSALAVGNVVTVEPGIYLEGKFGCRIEDMIVISEDGSVHNFTKSPKELIEL